MPSRARDDRLFSGAGPWSRTRRDAGGGGPWRPDVLRRDFLTSEGPFLFSVVVPEGNYRVTVHHGDLAGVSDLTIKAETRRLMIERAVSPTGRFRRSRFW